MCHKTRTRVMVEASDVQNISSNQSEARHQHRQKKECCHLRTHRLKQMRHPRVQQHPLCRHCDLHAKHRQHQQHRRNQIKHHFVTDCSERKFTVFSSSSASSPSLHTSPDRHINHKQSGRRVHANVIFYCWIAALLLSNESGSVQCYRSNLPSAVSSLTSSASSFSSLLSSSLSSLSSSSSSNSIATFSSSSSSSSSSTSNAVSVSNSDVFFRVRPVDAHVTEGESVEFKCQIHRDAYAPGPVQWSKDGFPLGFSPVIAEFDRYSMSVNESERIYNLNIRNVRLEDEAVFECQASSGLGALDDNGSSSSASGSGNSGGGSSLLSSGVSSISSSGVSNIAGIGSNSVTTKPIRASARLQLIVPPKSITINSTLSQPDAVQEASSSSGGVGRSQHHSGNSTSIIESHENEKTSLVCTVSNSKPPAHVKWYRKSIELLPEAARTTVSKTLLSNRHELFTVTSTLVLYPKTDEEYRCLAEHPALSRPIQATASVHIFRLPGSPQIEGGRRTITVKFQERVNLRCVSNGGYPPPSVIWRRNGIELDRTYGLVPGRSEVVNVLTFQASQADHQARFTCEVANTLSTQPLITSVVLNVHLFPTQVKIVAPREAVLARSQGTTVTLECSAYPSSPTPNDAQIRWLLDGKPVDAGNHDSRVHYTQHDTKSWTLRSNLTIVIHSREPAVRNVACIDPPERPVLLGVKNGVARVTAGSVFKCKCVSYGGSPTASLVWLADDNREISASTTSTVSGISSELVIRPVAADHGAHFRCHVLHPALAGLSPSLTSSSTSSNSATSSTSTSQQSTTPTFTSTSYEASFTLEVLFPPEYLNITASASVRENENIKIDCMSSPSNPCVRLTLLRNGDKIDGESNGKQSGGQVSRQLPLEYDEINNEEPDLSDTEDDIDGQHCQRVDWQSATEIGRGIEPIITSSHSGRRASFASSSSNVRQPRRAIKSISWRARPEDDGSRIECIAESTLIPGHDAPRLSGTVRTVRLRAGADTVLTIAVVANPPATQLKIVRLSSTVAQRFESRFLRDSQSTYDLDTNGEQMPVSIDELAALDDDVDKLPAHWSAQLSPKATDFAVHIRNATVQDAGLYLARVSNSVGESLWLGAVIVNTPFTINSIKLYSSSSPVSSTSSSSSSSASESDSLSDSVPSVSKVREGESFVTIECRVSAAATSTTTSASSAAAVLTDPSLGSTVTFSRLSSPNGTELNFAHLGTVQSFEIDSTRSNITQTALPTESGKSVTLSAKLQIFNITASDAGLYECSTRDDRRSIRLIVEHRPVILTRNGHRTAVESGETIKLLCAVIAYPDAEIQWSTPPTTAVAASANSGSFSQKRVHERIVHQRDSLLVSELILERVDESDFGDYVCAARNALGVAEINLSLVHKTIPDAPSNLSASNISHNGLTLQWTVQFTGGHATHFLVRIWSVSATTTNSNERNQLSSIVEQHTASFTSNSTLPWIHITGLEPETRYHCVVEAFNILGGSHDAARLDFRTTTVPSSEKPVHALADEQRLNGLIGAKIIGDDFLELTLALCVLAVICIVSIVSVLAYCHRRANNSTTKSTTNSEDTLTADLSEEAETKFANFLNEQGTQQQEQSHAHHHHHLHHQHHHPQLRQHPTGTSSVSTSTQDEKTRCGSTNSSYLTRSDDFPSPPTFATVAGMSAQQYLTVDKRKMQQLCCPTGYVSIQPDNAVVYPFELTASSPKEPTPNTFNYPLLLSHQQITNIHLLPESRSVVGGADPNSVDGRTGTGMVPSSGTATASNGANYDVCFAFAAASADGSKSVVCDDADQLPAPPQASQLQLSAYDIHYDAAAFSAHSSATDPNSTAASTFYIAAPFDLNYATTAEGASIQQSSSQQQHSLHSQPNNVSSTFLLPSTTNKQTNSALCRSSQPVTSIPPEANI